MSGQSITDRIAAAQHSMTGSAINKAVCKATTHEVSGPKKKHLDCECSFPSLCPAFLYITWDRFHKAENKHWCGPTRGPVARHPHA